MFFNGSKDIIEKPEIGKENKSKKNKNSRMTIKTTSSYDSRSIN